MTVNELIAELQQQHPDAEVVVLKDGKGVQVRFLAKVSQAGDRPGVDPGYVVITTRASGTT